MLSAWVVFHGGLKLVVAYPPSGAFSKAELSTCEDAILVYNSCPCATDGVRRFTTRVSTRHAKIATTLGDVRELLMHVPHANGSGPSL